MEETKQKIHKMTVLDYCFLKLKSKIRCRYKKVGENYERKMLKKERKL